MTVPLSTVRRAAFFDMDRTLVRVNTANLYMRWRFERREAGLRDMLRFMRWMAEYTLGVIDPEDITRRALEQLAGTREDAFRDELREWYRVFVRPHIALEARREVERCRRAGYELVILTASTHYGTDPLAEELGIDHVLCTQLEVDEGSFTGHVARLCYGPGKVAVAEAWADERGIELERCVFYTDSVSDLPMLDRVGERRVINPDPRLRIVARRRGWPVDYWR